MSLLLARIAQAHRNIGTTDPYWSLVQALLHFDGTSGSTTITDATGLRTWGATGGAAISTAQSKFGGASVLFGPSGSFISSSGTGMTIGTSDFAIEFWWRPNSAAGARFRTLLQGGATGGDITLQTASTTSNKLIFYGDGTTADLTESSAATSDVWHFYKLSRNGTALTLERDGTVTASATILTTKSFAGNGLQIGAGSGGGSGFGMDSWLDDFRWTVGTSRPGSGVPTAAFPNR